MKTRIVRINQTASYVSKDRLGIKGSIYGVYVYDVDKVVHCAELTGSRELYWVDWSTNEVLTDEQRDLLDEANCYESGEVKYIHCREADALDGKDWGEFESIEKAIGCHYFLNGVIWGNN